MNFNAARRLLDAPQARSALSRPAALIVAIGHHDACTLAAIGYTVSKTAVVGSRVARYSPASEASCPHLWPANSFTLTLGIDWHWRKSNETPDWPSTATMKRYSDTGLEGSEGFPQIVRGGARKSKFPRCRFVQIYENGHQSILSIVCCPRS